MAAKRKSWREKLADDKGLPKVITIEGRMTRKWGEGTCAIPAPREVDALMRRVRNGRVTTINHLRDAIAKKHGATMGCPITTGIFAWIAAQAKMLKAEGHRVVPGKGKQPPKIVDLDKKAVAVV